jgi:hypothetical protein
MRGRGNEDAQPPSKKRLREDQRERRELKAAKLRVRRAKGETENGSGPGSGGLFTLATEASVATLGRVTMRYPAVAGGNSSSTIGKQIRDAVLIRLSKAARHPYSKSLKVASPCAFAFSFSASTNAAHVISAEQSNRAATCASGSVDHESATSAFGCLSAGIKHNVRWDCAIESGKYRLDKGTMQNLHDRLPGGDTRTREFSREVDLSCDLLSAGILEKMRGAANH